MASPKLLKLHPECVELADGRLLELGSSIGKGSAATVYRSLLCSENGVKRAVAMKLFNAVSSDDSDQVCAVLLRAVRRVACIEHPNVVRAYECGIWRGQPFVISELVEGVSLLALQEAYAARHRRMPPDIALFIACEIGEALSGARVARDHDGVQLNMVHQSLAAREVLLSWRGEVKLSDFESSTARAATSSIRSLRGVAGRATAMAPEVAQGCMPDARADVFSFGILLRELFIGPRFPSSLTNSEAIRLAREGYVQPITFQPHLPNSLVGVMERALQVEPEARYPNATAMTLDLRRAALAMGVGDGRFFLKNALQREWSQYAEEVTCERHFPVPEAEEDAPPGLEAHEEHYELQDNDLLVPDDDY